MTGVGSAGGVEPRSDRALRVLVVGAGLTGRWHAHAARRAGARVVGFTDLDPARSGQLARVFKAAALGRTVEDALTQATVDVVHVCTPAGTHEDIVRSAFQGGCHVLCEKPLAPTAAVVERMYRLAEETERYLCPVHQYAFHRGFERASAHLSGAGRLLQIDAVACSAGADGLPEEDRDRLVGEILPHPLSLMRILLSELPEPSEWSARRTASGEWRIMGAVGGVGLGIILSASGRPTRNSLRLICERGTIHVDLFHGFAVREAGLVSRRRKALRPFLLSAHTAAAAGVNLLKRSLDRETAFPGLQTLTARFYDAVRGTAPLPLTHVHALDVARSRDALLALVRGSST